MKLRSMLILAFVVAAFLPTAVFAVWSYNTSVKKQFAEVTDRHLLLARSLGRALERYHIDLKATFDSVSLSLLSDDTPRHLVSLMASVNLLHVSILDSEGNPVGSVDSNLPIRGLRIEKDQFEQALKIAQSRTTKFSNVMGTSKHGNVILAVRKFGNKTAVGLVSTHYIAQLGKSISFGTKGHAAIVDAGGNVLAHPLSSWVNQRRNIKKVSAVQRMLNGETGIEKFYSPALKGDMIAGLTSVKGPGWGVMIPQPVSELYAKAKNSYKSIAYTFGLGLVLALLLAGLFLEALATPLEQLLRNMLANAKTRTLTRSEIDHGLFTVKEVNQLNSSYNMMVRRVSAAHRKIEKMAFTDPVTMLPNRERLELMAEDLLTSNGEAVGLGTIIQLNFDNFKEINDLYGHTTGDKFLKAQAKRLTNFMNTLSKSDGNRKAAGIKLARLGGDEFVVMIPNMTDVDQINNTLNLLNKFLAEQPKELSNVKQCSISVGAARYPHDGNTLADLLRKTDIALGQAKASGKNCWQLFDATAGVMSEAQIRKEVITAIQENQLRLEYQPKVTAGKGTVSGVEALVRWKHPEYGEISPAQWIPAIATSPEIIDLGRWVVNQAMTDHANWSKQGHDCTVAVNIGAKHFSKPGFAHCLKELAASRNFDPANLEIEVTEDALFQESADPADVISELQNAGFSVSIDDFGVGYSNISRLNTLTFDTIKLDRSVILSAQNSNRGGKILKSIVAMADALNCETVGEGIEDESMAQLCRSAGVSQFQGFHYSKSLPFDDLMKWLDSNEFSKRSSYEVKDLQVA